MTMRATPQPAIPVRKLHPASKEAAVRRVAKKYGLEYVNPEAICFPRRPGQVYSEPAVRAWLTAKQPAPALPPQRDHSERRSTARFVYFIQAGTRGLIKIGTSGNVAKRMASIRTMSPVPIELLLFVPGTNDRELSLHRKFRDLREHGEWFRPEPTLLRYIEKLKAVPR